MSEDGHDTSYVKVWMVLVGLLIVSIVGPMFEIQAVTLVTAFGVAVVKAFLVAKYFMHLTVQPRFVVYIVCGCLAMMVVFWAGVAPDVYKWEGVNWKKEHVIQEPAGDSHSDLLGDPADRHDRPRT
ncbi:MAG: caa(3)-type oxidase subunit IV [bacterium]|nr:caa(3)-type oxidase subunit IV [bacterium]